MARKKTVFKKTDWISVVGVILVMIIIVGVIGSVAAANKRETEEISSLSFSVGNLNDKGEYVDDKTSIYTKEAFNCIGLKVVPDFEALSTFSVYYYDYNDNFITAKKGLSYIYDEDFPLAKTCRIVINPEIPEDVDSKDFAIKFWEVSNYAKLYTITVDKDQDYKYEKCVNLYDPKKAEYEKAFNSSVYPSEWNGNELVSTAGGSKVYCSEKMYIQNSVNKVDMYVYLETNESAWPIIALFDEDGKIAYEKGFGTFGDLYTILDPGTVVKPIWVKLTLELPEAESYEGFYLRAVVPEASEEISPEETCFIFAYNE